MYSTSISFGTNPAHKNNFSHPAKKNQRGFSHIELLVSMAIITIISGFTLPPLIAMANKIDITTTQQTLLQDLRLLRAESINQGLPAYLCAVTPKGDCIRQNNWSTGWMGFIDINRNQRFDDHEKIISTFFPDKGLNVKVILRSGPKRIKINSLGIIVASGHFKVCDADILTKQHMKVIRMNNSGRMTLEKDYLACE